MVHFPTIEGVILEGENVWAFDNPDEIVTSYEYSAYGIVVFGDVVIVIFSSLKDI